MRKGEQNAKLQDVLYSKGRDYLRCCGRDITDFDRFIYLYDTKKHTNRIIKIKNECPVCGAFLAELEYLDIKKGFLEYDRPKRKHTAEWFKSYEKDFCAEIEFEEVEYGTQANMSWKFQTFGTVYDYNKTKLRWDGEHYTSTLEQYILS